MKRIFFKLTLIIAVLALINILSPGATAQSKKKKGKDRERIHINRENGTEMASSEYFDQKISPVSDSAQKYHDPGLKRVVQVALVVRDIEVSAKLWADLLGMPMPPISTTRPGKEVKETYRGKPSEGQAKLTFFNLGQVVIELLEPVGEGTSWKEFLDAKGEGVQHLGFQVVDPNKASKELDKSGYPIFHQGRYDSDDGTYIYHDTMEDLGVIVELLHSDGKK